MCGLATTSPWIWFGLGYTTLNNSFETNSYWSPRRYNAFGPRVEASLPVTDSVTFNIGSNINKMFEINFSGYSHHSTSGIQFDDRNEKLIKFEYIINESIQNQQKGHYEKIELTGQTNF